MRAKWTDGRSTRVQQPKSKLTTQERDRIITVVNNDEFKEMPPSQIVPILAERGEYIGSESTIYRILRGEKMLTHRLTSKPPEKKPPKNYLATGPNQVWSWDITYLPTTVRGKYLYLYMICDVYSRKIVGWEVHECESGEFASRLVQKAVLSEGIGNKPLVLHSDNGSSMKAATMLATLDRLGVVPSFSRPGVSNDNPFSEALFRTLKYRPSYPRKPFDEVGDGRRWVSGFVSWYNAEHRHSALKFVTPQQRHDKKDAEVLAKRNETYEAAKKKHPGRWSGKTRDWSVPAGTELNPAKCGRSRSAA